MGLNQGWIGKIILMYNWYKKKLSGIKCICTFIFNTNVSEFFAICKVVTQLSILYMSKK